MDIKHLTKEFNLDENQARAYLQILENGEVSASAISSETNIKRTTVYAITESLIKMGLIESYKAKSKKIFRPVSLCRLTQKISQTKERQTSLVESLYTLIPKSSSHLDNFKVTVLNGRSEIQDFYLSTHKKETCHKQIGSANHIIEQVGEVFMMHWVQKRINLKQTARSIWYKHDTISNNQIARLLRNNPEYSKVQYLKQTCIVPNMIWLVDKKVVLMSSPDERLSMVIIDSKPLYKTIELMFDMIWESLE